MVVGFTNCVAFFSLSFDSIFDFSEACGGVIGKVNSVFDRAHRALSVCISLRFWSPQWANRGGVYEKI